MLNRSSNLNKPHNSVITYILCYVSEPELFARYKTLKHQMVKGGYISSINESATIEKLAQYLFGLDAWNRSEQLFILLSLDLKKLKELDKLL